ncbi:hypothetical protein [uncultured Bradyrhizobium sp.]|uniref:hypothetical protein n=1 Tax=uncultured Bradyrhizobium sp. TaxID=199684 RepID=UPI0035CB68F3
MALTKKTRKTLVFTIAGLSLTAGLVGLMFGRYDSPDYRTEVATLKFLAANVILKKIENDDISATLAAGPYIYEYILSKNTVAKTALAPWYLEKLKDKKRWRSFEEERFVKLIGILSPVGIAAGYGSITTASIKLERWAKLRVMAWATLTMTGTGVAGYYLGYDDERDYENATFLKVMQEPNSWRKLAQIAHDCSEWKALPTSEGPPQVPVNANIEKKLKVLEDHLKQVDSECSQFEHWANYHCQQELIHEIIPTGDRRELPACAPRS